MELTLNAEIILSSDTDILRGDIRPARSEQSVSEYCALSPVELRQRLKIFTPNLSEFKSPLAVDNSKKSSEQIKR